MKLRRFLATFIAAAVVAVGLVGGATSANAAPPPVWEPVTTFSNVGVYWQPYDSPANKVGIPNVTAPGDVYIDCWVSAGQVGNVGDVWYRTWKVYYSNRSIDSDNSSQPWWTFAPYVDFSYSFHNNLVPQC